MISDEDLLAWAKFTRENDPKLFTILFNSFLGNVVRRSIFKKRSLK